MNFTRLKYYSGVCRRPISVFYCKIGRLKMWNMITRHSLAEHDKSRKYFIPTESCPCRHKNCPGHYARPEDVATLPWDIQTAFKCWSYTVSQSIVNGGIQCISAAVYNSCYSISWPPTLYWNRAKFSKKSTFGYICRRFLIKSPSQRLVGRHHLHKIVS